MHDKEVHNSAHYGNDTALSNVVGCAARRTRLFALREPGSLDQDQHISRTKKHGDHERKGGWLAGYDVALKVPPMVENGSVPMRRQGLALELNLSNRDCGKERRRAEEACDHGQKEQSLQYVDKRKFQFL